MSTGTSNRANQAFPTCRHKRPGLFVPERFTVRLVGLELRSSAVVTTPCNRKVIRTLEVSRTDPMGRNRGTGETLESKEEGRVKIPACGFPLSFLELREKAWSPSGELWRVP